MNQLKIEELDYQPDSTKLFEQIRDLELPVFLDSAAPHSMRGRFDLLTAQPQQLVKHHLNSTTYANNINYFIKLKETIADVTPPLSNDYHLPFVGGAVGYLGYDLGRELEKLPCFAQQDITLPDALMGIYTWAIIVDHRQQRTALLAHPRCSPSLLAEIKGRVTRTNPASTNKTPFQLLEPFRSNMTQQDYEQAFECIKRFIFSGDCYQINLAQRFSAQFSGDSWAAYCRLRAVAAAPFSAYLADNDFSIMSLSPERFIQVTNQRATTSPIKGTSARGATTELDKTMAQQLLNSAKDRAENLMIVDLLRNDLGKSCKPGSIHVDDLFELQTFDTVHHLVSTISGELGDDTSAVELLQNCFPGGSITGAPKIRAMEIIEQLEPHRRSAYCGAIGYLSCDGQMDTNIAIRTMICESNTIHCWGGGGIVADSICASEYQESLTKVEKLLDALT